MGIIKNKFEKAVDWDFVNQTEAVKLVGVSFPTFKRLRDTEKMPVHYVGSRPMYSKSELHQWMLDRKNKPKK